MVFLIFFFFHLKSRSKEYLIVFKDTPAIFFFFSQVQNEEHTLCQSFYYLDSNPNKIFLKALQSINHTARRKILRSRIRNSAIQRKVPRFKYNFLDASQTSCFVFFLFFFFSLVCLETRKTIATRTETKGQRFRTLRKKVFARYPFVVDALSIIYKIPRFLASKWKSLLSATFDRVPALRNVS